MGICSYRFCKAVNINLTLCILFFHSKNDRQISSVIGNKCTH